MNNSQKGDISEENVADNWEEAGDEVSDQLQKRQEELLRKKQREEELERLRKATSESQDLDLHQQRSSGMKPGFKILKRPESFPTMASSSGSGTDEGKSMHKTFEEKQAAYMEARERIFGEKTEFDDEPEIDLSNLRTEAPRAQYASNPRPRAPIPRLMSIQPPRYPTVPPSLPFNFPPPIGMQPNSFFMYQPGMPSVSTISNNPRQPIPDIIPPPIYPTLSTYDFSRSMEMLDASTRAPYGRPPTQLLMQPFSQYFLPKKTGSHDGEGQ